MKNNLVKAVASIATATTLLFSTATCFAATANTVTTYGEDGVTVKSTVSGVAEGQMVTYLAGADDGTIESKDDIVYITQWTSDGSDKVVSYKLKTVPANGTVAATVKYGSDVSETATALNADAYKTVEYDYVEAVYDASYVDVNLASEIVGNGSTVVATWEIDPNYELDKVIVNDVDVTATIGGNSYEVPYKKGGSKIEITTKAKEGTPTISTVSEPLEVEVKDAAGEVLPSVGAICQVVGTPDEYGIAVEYENGDPVVFGGQEYLFKAAGAENSDEGYYAVNLAGAEIKGTYVVKSYIVYGGKYYYGDPQTIVVE